MSSGLVCTGRRSTEGSEGVSLSVARLALDLLVIHQLKSGILRVGISFHLAHCLPPSPESNRSNRAALQPLRTDRTGRGFCCSGREIVPKPSRFNSGLLSSGRSL